MIDSKWLDSDTKRLPHRTWGWAAIGSGIMGILAIVSLIAYLIARESNPDTGILMNRLHDMGVILQFLLLIPIAIGLQRLLQTQNHTGSMGSPLFVVLILCLVIVSLLLIFPKIVSDILYMVPQGIFGGWLIFINLRLKGIISKGIRWFGILVGSGLLLVGLFPLGFALFVDSNPLQIPAAPPEDFPINGANLILHQVLNAGTLLGVLMLPFWTILLGIGFLRKKMIVAV